MGGGGGFGDPLERPAEQVLEDVRNEYVSVEAAGRDYGVAIIQDGPRRFSLDQVETARLRHRANPGGARASV
jgi:N-methylhydantoinase B